MIPWEGNGPVPGFRDSQVQVQHRVVNLGIFSLAFHYLQVQSGVTGSLTWWLALFSGRVV